MLHMLFCTCHLIYPVNHKISNTSSFSTTTPQYFTNTDVPCFMYQQFLNNVTVNNSVHTKKKKCFCILEVKLKHKFFEMELICIFVIYFVGFFPPTFVTFRNGLQFSLKIFEHFLFNLYLNNLASLQLSKCVFLLLMSSNCLLYTGRILIFAY